MAFDSLLPSVLVNERAKGGFELDSRVIGYIQMASCPLSFSPRRFDWERVRSSVDLSSLEQADSLSKGNDCVE